MSRKNGNPESFIQAMAAATASFDRPGLEEPPRLKHETKELEGRVSLDLPLPARDKLDSPEKFDRRLGELRERYSPFLRNLAPPLPYSRRQFPLQEFEFRFEADVPPRNGDRFTLSPYWH